MHYVTPTSLAELENARSGGAGLREKCVLTSSLVLLFSLQQASLARSTPADQLVAGKHLTGVRLCLRHYVSRAGSQSSVSGPSSGQPELTRFAANHIGDTCGFSSPKRFRARPRGKAIFADKAICAKFEQFCGRYSKIAPIC